METKVTPIGNRILARPLPPPAKSEGGIILLTDSESRSVKYASKRFEVIAPEQGVQDSKTGEWRRTTTLEPGDIILVGMYPGASVHDPDPALDGLFFINVHNIAGRVIEDWAEFGKYLPHTKNGSKRWRNP